MSEDSKDSGLESWAGRLPALALRKMAEGMPRERESSKAKVLAWMLRYRRHVLEESYRIEQSAQSTRRAGR